MPRSNIGQVTHVSSTPWATSQEADITRRALEAACWLLLGCWSNNSVNSHSSPGPFNRRILRAVRCCSAHTGVIDPATNDALRIVTECLRPTPADNLPIFAGIQLAELCRNGATLSLARRAMEPGHLRHSAFTCPSSANARRLKSRHSFVPAVQHLIGSSDNHGRRKDFFQGGSGDFPKIFSKGGQKWWNFFFTLWNWKKQFFLPIISKSRAARPPMPPFRSPCWKQQHMWAAVGGSPMECGVGGQSTSLRTFIRDTGTQPPRNDPPKKNLDPA